MLIPGGYFPDDLDTTSLALTVLRPHHEVVMSVLDHMLEYVNSDGTIQVSHTNKQYPQPLQDCTDHDEETSLKHE